MGDTCRSRGVTGIDPLPTVRDHGFPGRRALSGHRRPRPRHPHVSTACGLRSGRPCRTARTIASLSEGGTRSPCELRICEGALRQAGSRDHVFGDEPPRVVEAEPEVVDRDEEFAARAARSGRPSARSPAAAEQQRPRQHHPLGRRIDPSSSRRRGPSGTAAAPQRSRRRSRPVPAAAAAAPDEVGRERGQHQDGPRRTGPPSARTFHSGDTASGGRGPLLPIVRYGAVSRRPATPNAPAPAAYPPGRPAHGRIGKP